MLYCLRFSVTFLKFVICGAIHVERSFTLMKAGHLGRNIGEQEKCLVSLICVGIFIVLG